MRVVMATGNAGKLREMTALLAGLDFQLVAQSDLGVSPVDETGATFTDNKYSRAHEWTFDGGVRVPASASPHVVPRPYSVAEAIDPEEAFVASLASCHMLWFLALAAKRKLVVEEYIDEAVGHMRKNDAGKWAVTEVTLRPRVRFADGRPSREDFEAMHHEAHELCYIANSVKSTLRCEPVDRTGE